MLKQLTAGAHLEYMKTSLQGMLVISMFVCLHCVFVYARAYVYTCITSIHISRSLFKFGKENILLCRFGDALPDDGLVGLVVKAEPRHACTAIAPPPLNISLPDNVVFVALVERSVPGSGNESECTFQVLLTKDGVSFDTYILE